MSARRVPAWPVYVLALPAAVSIWAGWVGLGGLTGFGVVQVLPGIWDELKINTAVTLPIGMECYAAFALRVWLHPATPRRAREFARVSAIGALVLGALGQVVYHLMAAAGMTSAPWPVTTVVACLPVAVLGMGATLAHLLGEDDTEPAQPTRPEPALPGEPEPARSEPARPGADLPGPSYPTVGNGLVSTGPTLPDRQAGHLPGHLPAGWPGPARQTSPTLPEHLPGQVGPNGGARTGQAGSPGRSARSRGGQPGRPQTGQQRRASNGTPSNGQQRTDAELSPALRALAERTGGQPSQYAIRQELGVGSARAARLLAELDNHAPSTPGPVADGGNGAAPTREGGTP